MAGFEPATSCSQSRRANQAAPHPGRELRGRGLTTIPAQGRRSWKQPILRGVTQLRRQEARALPPKSDACTPRSSCPRRCSRPRPYTRRSIRERSNRGSRRSSHSVVEGCSGSSPTEGIAVDQASGTAYETNYGDGTVSVIGHRARSPTTSSTAGTCLPRRPLFQLPACPRTGSCTRQIYTETDGVWYHDTFWFDTGPS